MSNVHLDAVEHEHRIVFMHRVREGAASRSYGLQVAALAGVPRDTLDAARAKLLELETRAATSGEAGVEGSGQFALFQASEPEPAPVSRPPSATSALLSTLAELDPDELTPREALDALYRLRALASGKDGSA